MSYINVDITDHVKNDPEFPMRVEMAAIFSEDSPLVGRLFLTCGKGPHPIVLLLHGFPGIQQNTDWPYYLQQRGFHVLTAHYRGTWGSSGDFSFENCRDDVVAMLDYITLPDNLDHFNIDKDRIAVVGHSFGGALALLTAAKDSRISATAALSPFNIGLLGKQTSNDGEKQNNWLQVINNLLPLLSGAEEEQLLSEVTSNCEEWDLTNFAASFSNHPLLLTVATKDKETPMALNHDPLYRSLQEQEVSVDVVKLETDHHYLDKRETMAQLLLTWLKKHI